MTRCLFVDNNESVFIGLPIEEALCKMRRIGGEVYREEDGELLAYQKHFDNRLMTLHDSSYGGNPSIYFNVAGV